MALIPDIDRELFASGPVRVGAFRCPADHPSFADSGPIHEHCFVFPRTSVVIQHKDGRPFASDPTIVTLYNRGQEYRRQRLSPTGDRCDWYAVTDSVLREALHDVDPRAAADTERPIRFAFAPIDAATYLRQRQLFTAVQQDGQRDALYVEETVLGLLDRVLESAYADPALGDRDRRPRAADDIAKAARELLGRRFVEPLTLADVAAGVGTSLFYLCRSFRRATGTTLHEYRNQLRLRSALERLEEPDCDLSQLALSLGYSSHSHFSASFRRAFGTTPSVARRNIQRRRST